MPYIWLYSEIINGMGEYEEFELLSDKAGKTLKIDENCINYGKNWIEFTHFKFADYLKEDIWPICVSFYEKQNPKDFLIEEDSSYSSELYLHIDLKQILKKDTAKIREFIVNENNKCNPRYNKVHVETFDKRPGSDDLMAKFRQHYGVLEKIALLIT